MSVKHAKTSAKSDGADSTQVQPSDWNADHVIDTSGVAVAVGTDTGGQFQIQGSLGHRRVCAWIALGNTNSGPISAIGLPAPTYSGTVTQRNVATTTLFTSTRRVGVSSAATAGSFARASTAVLQFFLGNAAGMGGFRAVFRWGCSDAVTVSGARTFVGFGPSGVGSVDPSSMTNIIGVGTDAGDTTLYMMTNDASGNATKTALGANFPDHTLSTDVYQMELYVAPNSSSLKWQVTRLNTGDVANGTITTDLPAANALMYPQFSRNNNTTATSVAIDVMSLYIETEI